MAKSGTIEHRKTYKLADLLDVEPWAALGLLDAFWDWVGRVATDGDVTRFPLSQIAGGVHWRRDPKILMHALRACEVVEEIEGGVLYVHDFHDHAQDMYRKKLERSGKTFANGFPARMPRTGGVSSYELAGYTKPTAIPYLDNGETPSRQNAEKPAPVARQRRDDAAPKPPKNDPLGELRTRAVPSHPIPSNQETLIDQSVETGEPQAGAPSEPEPPGRPAQPAPPMPGGLVSSSTSETGPDGLALPAIQPGAGTALIDANIRDGESREECALRLHRERKRADLDGLKRLGGLTQEALRG